MAGESAERLRLAPHAREGHGARRALVGGWLARGVPLEPRRQVEDLLENDRRHGHRDDRDRERDAASGEVRAARRPRAAPDASARASGGPDGNPELDLAAPALT